MAAAIDALFTTLYLSEAKLAYQRTGPRLKGTVRTQNGVIGSSAVFPKYGTGAATTKTRHGRVVPMNLDHTSVTVSLTDRYAPEFVDKLDQLKTNVDERSAIIKSQVAVLGRETDDDIIQAMAAAVTATSYETTVTLTTERAIRNSVLAAVQAIQERDVPTDDDQLYAVISPSIHAALMAVDQYSNARYVGPDLPYVAGNNVRRTWLNVHWISHTGLNKATNTRHGYIYHSSSTGHAIQADVQLDANYVPERVAFLLNAYMSMGAVAIDTAGIQGLAIDESTALPTT